MAEENKEIKKGTGSESTTRREFLKMAGLLLGGTALVSRGLLKMQGANAVLSDTETSLGNRFIAGWTSNIWTQTTWADFMSGVYENVRVNDVLTTPYPDSVILDNTIDFFAFQGDYLGNGTGSKAFWRYDSTSNTWQTRPDALQPVGAGGSLAFPRDASNYQDNKYIYALCGNNTRYFLRYDMTNHSWVYMHETPDVVNRGGYLRWGGNHKIYAYQGGTTAFWVYDILTDAWTVLAPTSAATGAGASLVWTNASGYTDYIYGTLGNGSNVFRCYSINANTWTDVAVVPAVVGAGAELTHVNKTFTLDDGSTESYNHIYATQGGGTTGFYRYSLSDNSWATMAPVTGAITSGGALRWNGEGFIYAIQGSSNVMWRYNIRLNLWRSYLNPLPHTVIDGGAICADGTNYVYAFEGGSQYFQRYTINIDFTWSSLATIPETVGAGAALVYGKDSSGNNCIYALQGGTKAFWRYNIGTNDWTTTLAQPTFTNNVGVGGALSYDGTYIYALVGGGTTEFWRYSISGDSWSSLTAAPAGISYGGSMAYRSANNALYVMRGGNTTSFYRYDIGGTWSTLSAVPGAVGYGGALAYGSGNFIYAMRGNNTNSFYRYNIPAAKWQARATTTAPVGTGGIGGGALTYGGNGLYYALRGTNTSEFWRYSLVLNTWAVAMSSLLGITGLGAKMVGYVNAYHSSGYLESDVFDTGAADTTWDSLGWDEVLPAQADITFEVRASNTPFLLGDTAPAWTSVGGTAPISSGLPTGRYLQWKATLTSPNILATPVLEEVRVYY